MGNMIVAINALIAITRLVRELGSNMHEIGKIVATAQREGRDITQAELDAIEDQRKDAVQRFLDS